MLTTPPATLPTDSAEIAQLLDEHHLALTGDPEARRRFARGLAAGLESIPNTRVVEVEGMGLTSVEAACRAIGDALGGDDGVDPGSLGGLVSRLRTPRDDRREVIVWHDADALLAADPAGFGRLVHAILSVAGEQEYVSPDVLVLQRFVFMGEDALARYAKQHDGQFRAWHVDDREQFGKDLYACMERPQVLLYGLG